MLDSGAYSAWKRRKQVDLGEYIRFIERNAPWLSQYVVLDIIPGAPGRKRSVDEVNDAAEASYKNLLVMRRAGLNPMPVFHWGEDLRWLERYIDDGHDYIGVSAPKNGPIEQQLDWLDRVYARVGNVRTHGFGITNPALLLKYPFASVDSTTWALSPGYGRILVPRRAGDGLPDYGQPPDGVIMSANRQATDAQNARRFEILGPSDSNWVEDYLASIGISIYEARIDPRARRRALLHFFNSLQKHLPATTIFHATHFGASQSEDLTAHGVTNRLLSFYELKDHSDDAIRCYVETGRVPRKQPEGAIRPSWKKRPAIYRKQRALSLAHRVGLIAAS
jgi:hypothetical protein